jgi:hypothetical protein
MIFNGLPPDLPQRVNRGVHVEILNPLDHVRPPSFVTPQMYFSFFRVSTTFFCHLAETCLFYCASRLVAVE